jgi:hypothetical protein
MQIDVCHYADKCTTIHNSNASMETMNETGSRASPMLYTAAAYSSILHSSWQVARVAAEVVTHNPQFPAAQQYFLYCATVRTREHTQAQAKLNDNADNIG